MGDLIYNSLSELVYQKLYLERLNQKYSKAVCFITWRVLMIPDSNLAALTVELLYFESFQTSWWMLFVEPASILKCSGWVACFTNILSFGKHSIFHKVVLIFTSWWCSFMVGLVYIRGYEEQRKKKMEGRSKEMAVAHIDGSFAFQSKSRVWSRLWTFINCHSSIRRTYMLPGMHVPIRGIACCNEMTWGTPRTTFCFADDNNQDPCAFDAVYEKDSRETTYRGLYGP